VKYVLDAIATGQLQATGVLQDMGGDIPGGRAVALIDIDEDTSGYNIPGGPAAQVAVYTPYAHTSPSSDAFFCACGAGRILCSSKATVEAEVVAIRLPWGWKCECKSHARRESVIFTVGDGIGFPDGRVSFHTWCVSKR
jgi:hypothetical protein